jgi:hypothetical protein
VCYGGCRFQGQVVGRLPGSCIEYFQRVRKQLVECTLRASSTRFLEVGYPYIYKLSLLIAFTDMISSKPFVRHFAICFKSINLTELLYSYRWWPDPFGQHGSRWVPKSYSYFHHLTFLHRWTVSRREKEDILKRQVNSRSPFYLLGNMVLIHKDL